MAMRFSKSKNIRIRGQVSSIDVLVSAVIFVLIFVSLRGVWIQNIGEAEGNFYFSELQLKSESALDSLVKTQGFPLDWTISNVEIIGLADKPLVLSAAKVANFSSMDYNTARNIIGLGSYDFRMDIIAESPADNISIGKTLDANVFVYSVKRTVVYKGGIADVSFKVFSK
jgi:hypothetical protein